MVRSCKICGKNAYSDYCLLHKSRKSITVRKRPNRLGRRAVAYQIWRDDVAIPYLVLHKGYHCAICGSTRALDVDHIKKRGSHPELIKKLDNVRFLCRACHINVT